MRMSKYCDWLAMIAVPLVLRVIILSLSLRPHVSVATATIDTILLPLSFEPLSLANSWLVAVALLARIN